MSLTRTLASRVFLDIILDIVMVHAHDMANLVGYESCHVGIIGKINNSVHVDTPQIVTHAVRVSSSYHRSLVTKRDSSGGTCLSIVQILVNVR